MELIRVKKEKLNIFLDLKIDVNNDQQINLKNSFLHKQLTPLTICQDINGKYIVIDGVKRLSFVSSDVFLDCINLGVKTHEEIIKIYFQIHNNIPKNILRLSKFLVTLQPSLLYEIGNNSEFSCDDLDSIVKLQTYDFDRYVKSYTKIKQQIFNL